MPLAVKQDVAFNPVDLGLLGFPAVVQRADFGAHLVEETRSVLDRLSDNLVTHGHSI